MSGFQVYIDESGDEGFSFKPNRRGSSDWFVLSAAITRTEHDLATVKLVDAVRLELGREARSELHFRNLKHQQRLPLIRQIASARLRTVSVLVHKPSLEGDQYSEKGLLYRYATRLLLERVSWLCRDFRKDRAHKARLTFSNRANMSYKELFAYLRVLKDQTADVHIEWSAIDCDRIRTEAHAKLMGLQIADAVASGMYSAVNLNTHGFTEPRYAQMLRPVVYEHKGTRFGYGVKVWPAEMVKKTPPAEGTEWLLGGRW